MERCVSHPIPSTGMAPCITTSTKARAARWSRAGTANRRGAAETDAWSGAQPGASTSVAKIIGFQNSGAVIDDRFALIPHRSRRDSAIGADEFPIDAYSGRIVSAVIDGASGVPDPVAKSGILLERDRAIPPERAIADSGRSGPTQRSSRCPVSAASAAGRSRATGDEPVAVLPGQLAGVRSPDQVISTNSTQLPSGSSTMPIRTPVRISLTGTATVTSASAQACMMSSRFDTIKVT